MKNTVYNKKSNLDQFYTKDSVAKSCYDIICSKFDIEQFSLFVEPSAGKGAFLKLFPNSKRVGVDLDPQSPEIIKKDFLVEYTSPVTKKADKIITIGNPPFGRVCSTAVKFFNKAAEFSSIIAFIVPNTFKKNSIKKRLNELFHLRYEFDLPKNSFVFNEQEYNVPCCFQIWEKTSIKRKAPTKKENEYFDFTDKTHADFAIRRVGGNSGRAYLDFKNFSKSSNYFLKYIHTSVSLNSFIEMFGRINLSKEINATAGVRSLSKQELVNAVWKRMNV